MGKLEFCRLCGAQKEGENCPNEHSFKKMCLNCAFLRKNENEEMVCSNEDNKRSALDKILETISGTTTAYSVKTLEIDPLPLKKPTSKCQNWKIDDDVLIEMVSLFK